MTFAVRCPARGDSSRRFPQAFPRLSQASRQPTASIGGGNRMRNVTTRPARSLSAKAPGPGLLLVFLAVPLLAARAGEPTELPRARPEEVGISSERLNRVDVVVRRYIEQKKISGAVTLVARRGRVVHHEARGVMDIESKAPMRTDAIFRMASSTKPVTGVAILMLIEEGKVGLTDPVSNWFSTVVARFST